MEHKLLYHPDVAREDLSRIPANMRARILRAIEERLLEDPVLSGQPLRQSLKGHRFQGFGRSHYRTAGRPYRSGHHRGGQCRRAGRRRQVAHRRHCRQQPFPRRISQCADLEGTGCQRRLRRLARHRRAAWHERSAKRLLGRRAAQSRRNRRMEAGSRQKLLVG